MLFPVRLIWRNYRRRFHTPFRTASGIFEERAGIVLRAEMTDGSTRLGEIAPWPGFGCETLAQAEDFLRQGIHDGLPRQGACTQAAFSMLQEMGAAQNTSTPLRCAALLGAPTTVAELESKRNLGFSTFKLKINAIETTHGPEHVRAFLNALEPGERLRLDANGTLKSLDAWLGLLADARVEFIEQPFPPARMTDAEITTLPEELARKLALDESATHADSLPRDWPGFVVIKPALLGNWEAFRHWRRAHPETSVVYSSCFETAAGREAGLRLAAWDDKAATLAHGFDTLGVFEKSDVWEAHASGACVETLNWTSGAWDAWWEKTTHGLHADGRRESVFCP